jgi:hypothetical protein
VSRAEASKRVRESIVAATVAIVAREGVGALTHRRVATERLDGPDFDPVAWADELADWLLEQVTGEREVAVALYRLQIELADSPRARATHHTWGEGLRALGARVLEESAAGDLDIRLIVSALDGLRLSVLLSGEDPGWMRDAVRRQLQALLG